MRVHKFAAALCIGGLVWGGVAWALDSGPPHTLTRAAYCRDKLKICNSTAGDWCKGVGFADVLGCHSSVKRQCSAKFGSGSTCMSRTIKQ